MDRFEFVEREARPFQTLSEQLAGKIGFEATSLHFERTRDSTRGGRAHPPLPPPSRSCARVLKDEDELDAIRRAAEIGEFGL